MYVKTTPKFAKQVEKILQNYPAMKGKLSALIQDLKTHGLSHQFFNKYNIKPLGENFYRLKFIPIRIIISIDEDTVYLDQIFKRKGKGDYKFLRK